LENSELYDLSLKRITDEDIDTISKDEYPVIALKSELDKPSSLTPHIIKNKNIRVEEYAKIAENHNELRGINATTDRERDYLYKDTYKYSIGNKNTEERGIPKEKKKYFKSRSYKNKEREGISDLEDQYVENIKGRKERIK